MYNKGPQILTTYSKPSVIKVFNHLYKKCPWNQSRATLKVLQILCWQTGPTDSWTTHRGQQNSMNVVSTKQPQSGSQSLIKRLSNNCWQQVSSSLHHAGGLNTCFEVPPLHLRRLGRWHQETHIETPPGLPSPTRGCHTPPFSLIQWLFLYSNYLCM